MIETWSRGVVGENMPEAMLIDTMEAVHAHPWWPARARMVLDLLGNAGVSPPATVLDVGCGWGVNLRALELAGYRVTGMDVSRRMLEMIDAPARRLVEADLNQPFDEALASFDAMLALDVIEHLDDDRGVLRRLAGLLRIGGTVIVSVPARPDLFSEFDRMHGHRRRYLPDTLRAAFDETGIAVKTVFWWGAWMVPFARWRLESRSSSPLDYLRLPRWPVPQLMRLAYAWERRRAPRGKLRTGTSLFAVAERVAD